MKRDEPSPPSNRPHGERLAFRRTSSRLWSRLVDPERPVMRGLTFATTVVALVGGVGGAVAWFRAGEGSARPTSVGASPTATGVPEVSAIIGDCLSETADVALQMETFAVDEIIRLDIRADQDQLAFRPWDGTPNRLDQAARYLLVRHQCSKQFPPGLQIGAVNFAGRPAWQFEHGTYQLTGTYAVEDFGMGTGDVRWYHLRKVRPEDLR